MTRGILLIDKPGGLTSHDVVARVRRAAGTRKVGHAGTLDPMATGLLVLGLGSATRLLHYIVGLDKEYTATIRLGSATTTDDAEGEITETATIAAIDAVSDDAIASGIGALTGEIEQVPSTVSAIKVNGKRAYALAREGEEVTLSSRRVTVSAFDVLDQRREGAHIDLDVRVECTTGTYIRALARDLGAGLGVGGHLTALRRSRIGAFDVADASTLDDLDVAAALLHPAAAADLTLDTLSVSADDARDIGHGKRIARPDDIAGGILAAIDPAGELIAILETRKDTLKVVTGFPQEGPAS
ncbi:tRNA pseudouridine(55) synthase TruB [Agromyces atrinae]|uniref:tRNA pseudouridine synthase B n=1 Tax=Agromyces atrinae TaxID=592376 RepID=A0A4V1R271_9MICO|nr:tRNA pseudouridine(55) synthase TruB [Agromyces atrinae]NYD65783.1 tRNA pseudouridine55 synthase [Agromyces atrinae]RXZ86136.1 tRNA pseudouridine(55) synthase TruB [Agromyces atrinae]